MTQADPARTKTPLFSAGNISELALYYRGSVLGMLEGGGRVGMGGVGVALGWRELGVGWRKGRAGGQAGEEAGGRVAEEEGRG